METIVGVVGGALAGFATSYFFWSREQRRDRPFVVVEAKNPESMSTAIFSIRNTGFTHAQDVLIKPPSGWARYGYHEHMEPKASHQFHVLREDEECEVEVTYRDVWGNRYADTWWISGPVWEEEGEEDEEGRIKSHFDPFLIYRKQSRDTW